MASIASQAPKRTTALKTWLVFMASLLILVLLPVARASASTYNPLKAVQYADLWWNKRNPRFQSYGFSDCANYVSQCLIAGGLNLRVSPSADKSGSIATCSGLDTYLTNTLKATVWKTSSVARPPAALQPGDVAIFGNWLGLRHAVFVSALQSNGQPLFNAHTYNRLRTTISWLFSGWTYVKYYHIVKSPLVVTVASKPASSAKTAVVAQPAVTTRSSLPATLPEPSSQPAKPASLVITLVPSLVTPTSATLNGTINADGQPTLWFFEYGESENYDSATDKQGPLLGNMTNDVSAPIFGLKPGTSYHARLVRMALDGTLLTGQDIIFLTPEETRAAPIVEN